MSHTKKFSILPMLLNLPIHPYAMRENEYVDPIALE